MESVEKIYPVSPSKARKKKRQPGKWKHNCAKKLSELLYCHSAQGRQYLPAEMNIAKLSRMYNDKVTPELQAKQPNLVKMQKLLDIKRLLELNFSLNWRDNPLLAFYQPLIDIIQGAHHANDDVEEDEELICELMEESPEFCV
uniref:Uncharacterized protein n=1 Tax=Timema monikensis TaxID=170555 RepID=A0A7R9HQ79_9NEOP|nr:unnamed protein product [Timema monikensis]